MFFGVKPISANESLRPSPLPNAVKCRKVKKSVKISEDSPEKSLMPPTFFGCHLRQKIDQKRRLSGRLSRIHFCDLVHGGGLVFVLYVIVASLAGRDHFTREQLREMAEFQPTRPLRDATLYRILELYGCTISTHASLAGRDVVSGGEMFCAENFNPRVPCGTRHYVAIMRIKFHDISTHASLAGRDMKGMKKRAILIEFQPTRPLRDATPPQNGLLPAL